MLLATLLLIPCGCSETKAAQAKVDLNNIGKAVLAYKTSTGQWPENLESLTEKEPDGGNIYLSTNTLVDPWGRRYQYDAKEHHPDTGQPLIWSEGPNPGSAASKIANWTVKE
jgi:hypothetical protein